MKAVALLAVLSSVLAACAPPCRDARCSFRPTGPSQQHALEANEPEPAAAAQGSPALPAQSLPATPPASDAPVTPATPGTTDAPATPPTPPAAPVPTDGTIGMKVVTDPAKIELQPGGETIVQPLVKVTAPGLDASADLAIEVTVTDDSKGEGRAYVFSNRGAEDLGVYVWRLEGAGGKFAGAPGRELMLLGPGKQQRSRLWFGASSTSPGVRGSYRLIVMPFYLGRWGDPRTRVLTDAGKKVDAVFRAIEKRLDGSTVR